MLAALLPLVLLLLFPAVADPAAPTAGAGFDVERYRFELRLDAADDRIEGVARVEGIFVEAGRTELVLDLVGLEPASGGGRVTGMRVDRVSRVEGGAVAFRQEPERLVLTWPEPSAQGARAAFEIAYAGVPADGLIVSRNRHGERTWFGDNWPDRARHWLPSVDHPRDKALVEFEVVAPDDYQVVAVGALREETDLPGELRRTRWQSGAALPTKVMVIGVARFAVEHLGAVAGVPLASWVYAPERDRGFADYRIAERVLPVMVDLLGPFPYAKLANVQSTTRWGGMENAGAIFYSERSVGGGRDLEALVAHEIAHQWFGDAVTESDWPHSWISEGFATYLTQLYFERTVGEARFDAGMAEARERVVRFSRERPERAVVGRRPAREMLDANTYQKGAWVLHMLRAEIGDRAFFDGLREIVARHLHANASTDDVRAAFESAARLEAGALSGFFAQWLERAGQPRLAVDWRYEAAGRAAVVEVHQVQEGAPFDAAVDLGVVTGGGEMTIHRVALSGRETVARLPVGAAPVAVVVDPGVRLLMELEPPAR